ncbi:MAG: hypothetical protein IIC49_01230 [Planctomycetes bacterium]|nr:hypothetical protein [Planctomycetota bacterium]MCH7960934.1 hypothetical protein [Planctomycetota bacterium]MCH9057514.1 hypothetical protein [Planctomycetota bacterium]
MPTVTIRIMCPNLTCRKVLAVPVSARGKTVRCRGCGISIRIPQPPESHEPNEKEDSQDEEQKVSSPS